VEETAHTLNGDDVKVVSLAINNGASSLAAAKQMMTRLAVATNSLAPAAGVDCNDDGGGQYGDLGPGEPLVCEVNARTTGDKGANVGPAIIGLLIGVKDPGTVAVDVRDDYRVVQRPIQGLTRAIKNLKYESGLRFTMSVRCTQAQDGKDLPVQLVPSVRSLPVGLSGQVLVRCRSIPLPIVVPPRPDPPPPIAPPRPLVAIAPVVPAPVNPPAQPISNMNFNAGFSHQEEQQFQVAAVTQDAVEEQPDVVELEMSALPPQRHQGGTLALGGATVLTGMAFAYQRRLQRRTKVRHVRI
jgi:hypothetical protein